MGAHKNRKQRFLQKHPYCCFCGGGEQATEIDHIPSRQLFDHRAWPEHFEFPACRKCNQCTRDEEQIVALLSKIYTTPDRPVPPAELRKIWKAALNNYPSLVVEMVPSMSQRDTVLNRFASNDQSRLVPPYAGIANARGPIVNQAISKFAVKLTCALHYKHTATILSGNGIIGMKWFTNEVLLSGGIPVNFGSFIKTPPPMQRANIDLTDQFDYKFGIDIEHSASVFFCSFRLSFAMFAVASADPSYLSVTDGGLQILRPFQHRNQP
jgi:hypothetical protein